MPPAPPGYNAAPVAAKAPLAHNQARIKDGRSYYGGVCVMPEVWPNEEWRMRGGPAHHLGGGGWPAGWKPADGMVGTIKHKWDITTTWSGSVNYLLEVDGQMVVMKEEALEFAATTDF